MHKDSLIYKSLGIPDSYQVGTALISTKGRESKETHDYYSMSF